MLLLSTPLDLIAHRLGVLRLRPIAPNSYAQLLLWPAGTTWVVLLADRPGGGVTATVPTRHHLLTSRLRSAPFRPTRRCRECPRPVPAEAAAGAAGRTDGRPPATSVPAPFTPPMPPFEPFTPVEPARAPAHSHAADPTPEPVLLPSPGRRSSTRRRSTGRPVPSRRPNRGVRSSRTSEPMSTKSRLPPYRWKLLLKRRRRFRCGDGSGTNMPPTPGVAPTTAPPQAADAEAVRALVEDFESGVERAKRHAFAPAPLEPVPVQPAGNGYRGDGVANGNGAGNGHGAPLTRREPGATLQALQGSSR